MTIFYKAAYSSLGLRYALPYSLAGSLFSKIKRTFMLGACRLHRDDGQGRYPIAVNGALERRIMVPRLLGMAIRYKGKAFDHNWF